MNSNKDISWNMSGIEVEQESFRRIDAEYTGKKFSEKEWPVVRRVIHSTADLTISELFRFSNNPVDALLDALKDGCSIYCDSNMIKSGLSKAKLSKINPIYKEDNIVCLVADQEIAKLAKQQHCTRSLIAVEFAADTIDDGIVLIGNAPLALAGIIKMYKEHKVKPRVIIGMPVGFVNVLESKEMLFETNIPFVAIEGRRGGSPLAVASLHGMLENQ